MNKVGNLFFRIFSGEVVEEAEALLRGWTSDRPAAKKVLDLVIALAKSSREKDRRLGDATKEIARLQYALQTIQKDGSKLCNGSTDSVDSTKIPLASSSPRSVRFVYIASLDPSSISTFTCIFPGYQSRRRSQQEGTRERSSYSKVVEQISFTTSKIIGLPEP